MQPILPEIDKHNVALLVKTIETDERLQNILLEENWNNLRLALGPITRNNKNFKIGEFTYEFNIVDRTLICFMLAIGYDLEYILNKVFDVSTMTRYLFSGINGVDSLTIPAGKGARSKTGVYMVPGAFEGMQDLKEVNVDCDTKSINMGAFKDCNKLKTIYFNCNTLDEINKAIWFQNSDGAPKQDISIVCTDGVGVFSWGSFKITKRI